MAAADTETTPTAGAGNPLDRAREALARLSNRQKVVLMVAIAAVIALLVAAGTLLRQSEFRILFSNIGERDGGAIIAALEQMNIPFRFNESGSAILVPAARVHDVRLRLASQGLPRGGAVGFELMESQKFGISQFAEQINYQRSLEDELSRTIQSIAAVQAARVHLAIPKPSVFMREEIKPSASVMLSLYPGRSLDAAQIAGIQNLVAASVPQLAASSVTLLDQSGTLLSQMKSRLLEAGLDPTQVKSIQEVEASIIKRVEDILAPIVGPGNARVQIAADIDFSQSEQTAETHRPNALPPEISIRSQQINETASTSPTAQKVPGALSNQPPVPSTAPLTQTATPGSASAASAAQPAPGQINAAGVQAPIASVGQPISTSKNSTINYEVDKTIRHIKQSVGTVKRLSGAVVVNQRKEIGKDGKSISKPLPDTELRQISDLVKEAMGFSKDRGDTISVANAPFTAIDRDEGLPAWRDPEVLSLAKELIKYVAIAAIIAYLLLGVVRPLLKTMLEPAAGSTAAGIGSRIDLLADEEDEEHQPEQVPTAAALLEKRLAEARTLAQQDPQLVANIVQEWMNPNGS